MTGRLLSATGLVLLAYAAACFSLWVQLDPFASGAAALPFLAAGSGAAFGVAAFGLAGRRPPAGFALVGVGLNAAALAAATLVVAWV